MALARRLRLWLTLAAAATFAAPRVVTAQSPQDLEDQAEAAFARLELDRSVEIYDRLADLVPSARPTLWPRGIALYFVGRYQDCQAQFASLHALDSMDLENASWELLCAARATTLDHARQAAKPAGPDPRIMRTDIYQMFLGQLTPDDVIEHAGSLPVAQFYAHLYVGLYFDLIGEHTLALVHLRQAASDDYREYGGFMSTVAQVSVSVVGGRR